MPAAVTVTRYGAPAVTVGRDARTKWLIAICVGLGVFAGVSRGTRFTASCTGRVCVGRDRTRRVGVFAVLGFGVGVGVVVVVPV